MIQSHYVTSRTYIYARKAVKLTHATNKCTLTKQNKEHQK